MKFRLAIESDYSQIAKLHHDSYHEAVKGNLPQQFLNHLTTDLFATRWEERIKDPNLLTLVAEENDQILGFAAVKFNQQSEKYNTPFLNCFYVHIDHFRKGIGTQLAVELGKVLVERGCNTITGVVQKNDVRSNAFYLKVGAEPKGEENAWLPYGTTPNTYPNGTYTDVSHYMVNDIEKILSMFKGSQNNLERTTNHGLNFFSSEANDKPNLKKPVDSAERFFSSLDSEEPRTVFDW